MTDSAQGSIVAAKVADHESGNKQEVTFQEANFFFGPLPRPDVLKSYEELLPGAAERLMKMAETQASHRQELEKTTICAGARDSQLGIISALVCSVSGFAVVGFAFHMGHPTAAATLGTGLIGGLVSTFIYGTRSSRLERADRAEANQPPHASEDQK